MYCYKVAEFGQEFETIGYEPATYVGDYEPGLTRYKVTDVDGTNYEFQFTVPGYAHSSHLVEIARNMSDCNYGFQSIIVL